MKGKLRYKTKENAGEQYPVDSVEKSEDSSQVESEKNSDTLVSLEDRRKKKVDETIDTPVRFLSWYHYESNNLDNSLELCPHCRKPNLYTYRNVVIDSALKYLEEKEEQRGRYVNRSMLVGWIAGLLLISAGLYYLLFHVLSGARV